MKKSITLANFGKLPLANNLLNSPDEHFETYPLIVGFDPETSLVHLKKNAPKELMFNEKYVYNSSKSETMVKHFKNIANKLNKTFKPNSVLEIGSNSGEFIKHFNNSYKVVWAIEPCLNFANKTRQMGIPTRCDYWSESLSIELFGDNNKFDLIYSSNTISHIHDLDSCFKGIKHVLAKNGVFVMESPSLLSIINNNIIDQFYHEHQSYFSLTTLDKILQKYGLKVFDIEELDVHGGSIRYYIKHKEKRYCYSVTSKVKNFKRKEQKLGLTNPDKLKESFKRMKQNLKDLKKYLVKHWRYSYIVGYGATAKLSLVLNLAKINRNLIKYVFDTTPEKQNKYIPGTGIKIIPYNKEHFMDSKICFLGAWNYKDEILKKEKHYGGVFLTHIPKLKIILPNK